MTSLEGLKKVTYQNNLVAVIELLKARISLSVYSGAKTAQLKVPFVFLKEDLHLVEKAFDCKVKLQYCVRGNNTEIPYASLFTIKLV